MSRNNPRAAGVGTVMKLYGGRVLCAVAVLSVALMAAKAQQVYFPDNTFDPILQRWFSSELHILGEPSLLELSKDTAVESYRFLWLRTFNQPIAVRLDIKPDGTGILTTKVGNGEAGFPYTSKALIKNVARGVSRNEVQSFLKRMDELRFWSVPTLVEGNQTGTDGSEWIIEAVKAGSYHTAERWCADNTPTKRVIHQLGITLAIELAQLNIPNKDIY
jgi:hypothetical protein